MIRRFAVAASFAACCLVPHLASAAEIGPTGPVEKVHGGFAFTEGPVADGEGGIYFSDIPASSINHLTADGELTTFVTPSGSANGLMMLATGELGACEMEGQLTAYSLADKTRRVIADGYEGARFNAPNDFVVDAEGGIYMTDPHFRAPTPLPQEVTAVYYIAAGGEVTRVVPDLPAPNGVILSPDEKTLYVAPSGQAEMMAYPVEGPGKLGEGRVFFRLQQREEGGNGGSDGITVDELGNVYFTTALGLQVVSPEGELVKIIEFPEQPANVTFSGPDYQTIYVTARTSVYRVPMSVAGVQFGRRGEE